jgi:tetratricopeptide (TPR) repeat protein
MARSKTKSSKPKPGDRATTADAIGSEGYRAGRSPGRTTFVVAATVLVLMGGIAWAFYLNWSVDSQGPPTLNASPVSRWQIPPRPEHNATDKAEAMAGLASQTFEESFAVAERLVSTFPRDPHALNVLAVVHQRFRNEATSIALWERCLELDPQYTPAISSLAQLASARGDFAEAQRWLSEALRFEPDSSDFAVRLAESLMRQSDLEGAEEVLQRQLEQQPDSADVWRMLGSVREQQGEYAAAQSAWERALAIGGDNLESLLGLATALQRQAMADRAKEYFQRADALRREQGVPTEFADTVTADRQRLKQTLTDTLIQAGRAYANNNRYEEAEAVWQRAVAVDPAQIESRTLLAQIYLQRGDAEAALRVNTDLTKLLGDDFDLWASTGVLAIRAQRYAEAERLLEHAHQLAPDNDRVLSLRAQVHMTEGFDSADAVRFARRAVELNPSGGNQYVLSTAYWHEKQLDQAIAAIKAALLTDPGNTEYQQVYRFLQAEL